MTYKYCIHVCLNKLGIFKSAQKWALHLGSVYVAAWGQIMIEVWLWVYMHSHGNNGSCCEV